MIDRSTLFDKFNSIFVASVLFVLTFITGLEINFIMWSADSLLGCGCGGPFVHDLDGGSIRDKEQT